MTLFELKEAVSSELSRRDLTQPDRRGRELQHVCDFIVSHASEYLLNGNIHLPSNKEHFKEKYESHKGYKLNCAESSIINEIYNQYEMGD